MMTAKVFENGRSQAVDMFSDDFLQDGRAGQDGSVEQDRESL